MCYDGVWVDAQAQQRDRRAMGRHARRRTRAAAAGPASHLVHAFVTLSNTDQGSVPWRRPSVALPSQELSPEPAEPTTLGRAAQRGAAWCSRRASPRFTPRVRATGGVRHAIAQPRQPHAAPAHTAWCTVTAAAHAQPHQGTTSTSHQHQHSSAAYNSPASAALPWQLGCDHSSTVTRAQ